MFTGKILFRDTSSQSSTPNTRVLLVIGKVIVPSEFPAVSENFYDISGDEEIGTMQIDYDNPTDVSEQVYDLTLTNLGEMILEDE